MKMDLSILRRPSQPVGSGGQHYVTPTFGTDEPETMNPELQERMNEVLSPAWESYGGYGQPAKTRAQFLKQLQGTGNVVPDLVWNVEEVLQDGNRFVVRGRATATPVRPFLGVAPSGKRFEIMSIDIHTVENHKIVKSYHVEDWHAAIEQLQGK